MNAATNDPDYYPSDDNNETEELVETEEVEKRCDEILQQRMDALECQKKQANKMLEMSQKRFIF